ncbi:hypothetical protein Dsin_027612 [Dipteronia sinensis]|uniref:Endonuclease/exonuclease/phosphatase domain-containing protein n=1 Tax=Dipteronia sinensis TaxID=43782 RepID=A0AAE0DTR3_9ROSI|nr:hypothetical protein Dsin_027612 [Dipteronia sinensis]
MLAMSWNVRGLGKAEKRRKVKSFVLSHKPGILFIQESKLNIFVLGWVSSKCGDGPKKVYHVFMVANLSLRGISFTRSNNIVDGSWARLDRFLISPIILSWIPNLIQNGFPRTVSDHHVISIGVGGENWGPRPFRIFNEWTEDKELIKEVKSGWNGCRITESGSNILLSKLKAVKIQIKKWVANKKTVS